MRIELQSVTVQAFRGIPDERTFEFDGRNIVVYGPNGTGKSTILQAIEFLLTGEIAALRGRATGGIHPTKHVPNRNADPDDTVVRATFCDGEGEPFQVYRRFTSRDKLVAERRPPEFRELQRTARRGSLLLTREQLLELVITTPGDRKEQIYQLLNTAGVDERRRQLKRLARKARSETDKRQDRGQRALERIRETIESNATVVRTSSDNDLTLDIDALLIAVNRRRRNLGGDALASLDGPAGFRDGVESPVEQAGHPLQRADVRHRLETLREWFDRADQSKANLENLREGLRALRADSAALSSLAELAVVQRGRVVVDETTTECPLCGTGWERGKLADRVEGRERQLVRIEERSETITETSAELARTVDGIVLPARHVLDALDESAVDVDLNPLEQYTSALDELGNLLDGDLLDGIEDLEVDRLDVPLVDDEVSAVVEALDRTAESLSARSTLEADWEDLGSLSEAYRDWLDAARERAAYERAVSELDAARRTFVAARNDVLDDVYEELNDRFAQLYREINPDERTFDPELGQTDTGVSFSVDFYDDGEHPPNALHSEGHQDLMGICLFLALAELLSPLERAPILLDDVVMSIDSGHRQRFADVLVEALLDRFQFVVTTHDDAWARQLLDAGLVEESNSVGFEGWSLSDGPFKAVSE